MQLKLPCRCSRNDCIAPAVWQPGWRAWAKGYPRKRQFEIVAYLGIALCDAHKADTTIKDLITDQGCDMVNRELRSMRRAELDFTHAEPVFQKITDGPPKGSPTAA